MARSAMLFLCVALIGCGGGEESTQENEPVAGAGTEPQSPVKSVQQPEGNDEHSGTMKGPTQPAVVKTPHHGPNPSVAAGPGSHGMGASRALE